MSDEDEQIQLIKAAIESLSKSQGKMTITDIKKETGIQDPTEILYYLDNCGYIYYVSPGEFKKTP